MNTEKEIEEVCRIIEETVGVGSGDSVVGCRSAAEYIVKIGYHKEARKEAAKEIFKEVYRLLDETIPHTKEQTTLLCLGGWIMTKYGIEVDE